MLYGLQGSPVGDLHTTKEHGIMGLERPGGLFSNPMFVGTRVPSSTFGRVYSNPGEIAGHHIVYAVDDGEEGEQLVVKAVPLQHYPEGARSSVFDVSDFVDITDSRVELVPWLPGLAISVGLDQVRCTHLTLSVSD